MIVCFSGGVGGAKLALGLARLLAPDRLVVIANMGDDIELLGLRICPDLDTILYTLAGKANAATGWGIEGDSFRCFQALRSFGWPGWFRLGDIDLATHLWRSELLREGRKMGEVTRLMAQALGVMQQVLPATEDFVPTYLETDQGMLHLQEYLVREQCRPIVRRVEYRQAAMAQAAPGVVEAIERAEAVVFAPSNPFISIAPSLSIPGIESALRSRRCPVVAVSPIIGGKALKGPAAKMLCELGSKSSAAAVAALYQGTVDCFILDEADRALAPEVAQLGMKASVMNTVMKTPEQKMALARGVLAAAGVDE
jgi:LPPG:FO 2-phospho-L-lactate transferase